jgi:Integrase core domain
LGHRTSLSATRPRYVVWCWFPKSCPSDGNKEVLTAPRSPWQNPYAERIIGSIRRECLDHVIIFNETHLRRVLSCYFRYYHRSRTHLSLNKDCPDPRRILPPSAGKIVASPEVGGLHHRYERRAARTTAIVARAVASTISRLSRHCVGSAHIRVSDQDLSILTITVTEFPRTDKFLSMTGRRG